MSKLGEFIDQRRLELGIRSHRELASRCGDIDHNVIDDILNDKANLSKMQLGTFERLSSGLDVSVEVLVALATPNAVHREISPDTRQLHEEIELLPEAGRELIRLAMLALRLKEAQKLPADRHRSGRKHGHRSE